MVRLQIANMQEESKDEDVVDTADLRVYSDGLGIEGMAGVAAIMFRNGQEVKSICYLLGLLTHHTTYEAEVVGILLALELIHRERSASSATIRLDNQAVIQALGGRHAKLVQALLNLVHKGSNDWLTSDGDSDSPGQRQLSIHWVSRHDGVHGNERTDKEARRAVSIGSSPESKLPEMLQGHTLPCSLAALCSKFKELLKLRWRAMWAKSPWKGWMDRINDKLPSHSFLMVTNHLSQAQASVLMQLRTDHSPLNHFLHRIGKIDSPTCPACRSTDETVLHYLLDCPGYTHEWHGLFQAVGLNSKSLWHLLGNWRAYKALLIYISTTGRFKDTYGDLQVFSAQADVFSSHPPL